MSRRQTWGRDARSDAPEIQVMVRCQNNRVIGAGLQAGRLHLIRIFSPPAISTRLLNYVTEAESGPLGPYQCPNHKEDHTIDAARLREVIYQLNPEGRTKKRGVPSIDIKKVEFA